MRGNSHSPLVQASPPPLAPSALVADRQAPPSEALAKGPGEWGLGGGWEVNRPAKWGGVGYAVEFESMSTAPSVLDVSALPQSAQPIGFVSASGFPSSPPPGFSPLFHQAGVPPPAVSFAT